MNASIEKFDPTVPGQYAIPCIVLGLGLKADAPQIAHDSTTFTRNAVKAWQDAVGGSVLRSPGLAGTPEGENTKLRVAKLDVGNTPDNMTGAQDGGNGSGGDAAGQEFHADMIDSRLGFTFWKRDSGGAQTALGTRASPQARAIYGAHYDPGFARFFPSHHHAFDFLRIGGAGEFLNSTFDHVLVVAVRADASDFPHPQAAGVLKTA